MDVDCLQLWYIQYSECTVAHATHNIINRKLVHNYRYAHAVRSMAIRSETITPISNYSVVCAHSHVIQ